MNQPQKEPSNGVEWMLQNAQVDHASLADAMTAAYYPGLYSFAYRLSGIRRSADKMAARAIAEGVTGRHRIFSDTSLRAWLHAHVYRQCAGVKGNRALWTRSFLNTPRPVHPCKGMVDDKLPANVEKGQALLLALHYEHSFSIDEIAFVLDFDVETTLFRLNMARLAFYTVVFQENDLSSDHVRTIGLAHAGAESRLSAVEQSELQDHLDSCSACQTYLARLPELEAALLRSFISEPVEDINAAHDKILNMTGINKQHSKIFLPVKELALVSVLLVVLVLFGRYQGIFNPYDARPTVTSTITDSVVNSPGPSPIPPPTPVFVLPGEEGKDYFFFKYYGAEDSLETLAQKAGLTPDEIRQINGNPERFVIGGREINLVAFRDSGWFDQLPPTQEPPSLPPLSESSTSQDILERIEKSFQLKQNLWIDAVLVHYGLPGYIGPPNLSDRVQVWRSGSERWVIASAFFDQEDMVYVLFSAGNWIFNRSERGFEGNYAETDSPGLTSFLFGGPPVFPLEDISILDYGETGVVADREAVSISFYLDDFRRIRLWVDALTGVPLSTELYEIGHNEMVATEFRVNAIAYDVDFPADLFYPPTSPVMGLAQSYRGEPLQEDPESLPVDWSVFALRHPIEDRTPPPDDFDLARASLIFQQLHLNSETDSNKGLEVFADDYFLGSLEIPETILKSCRRSPDGFNALIATSAHPLFTESTTLYWLRLAPFEAHKLLEQGYGAPDSAFSPDSKKLAYLGCEGSCGLYIVDLESGETMRIAPGYGFGQNLAWSPDGAQIAYISSGPNQNLRATVVDANTGEELFSSQYDWNKMEFISPGSPTESWGVPFPPESIQEGCYK